MEENNHMKKILPTAEQDIHVADEVKENKMLKGDGADLEAIHVAVEAKEKKVLKGDGADLETLKAKRTQSELGSRKKVCLSSASVAYHRTNMYFKEIEGGLCKNELLFRLIHWWEARHTSKDGLLLGLEMLLIDEHGETIKGFIAPNWMPRFQRDLKRGSVFRLTHFYAKANNETFRISDHPQKICFTNLSRFIEVYDDIPEIEADFFRFRPFAEFEASADKKLGLYDVMGQVKHIDGNTVQQESDIAGLRSNIADGEKEKFTVHLQLEGGELVIINLWDNAAAEFGEKYRGSKNNPTVLLVTTVNPKRFLGRVTLNSMSPSRVFIDKDIPTTEAFLNSLGASRRSAVTVQRTECKVTKLETVTLGEILQTRNEKAILTPRNETVDEINRYMLSQLEGQSKEYSSDGFGKADTNSEQNKMLYPVEYLNNLEYPGLPTHRLCLKIGAPIMLLRNINQKEGLCNGTRLIVTYMGDRVIEGEIITGTHVGQKVLLPRIILSPTDSKHPFTLRRRQFPIRLCFAMTINKSQGQTLKSVVLYLPKPVFTHGQLYVALSRVTSKKGLNIIQAEDHDQEGVTSIVYKEIYNGLIPS